MYVPWSSVGNELTITRLAMCLSPMRKRLDSQASVPVSQVLGVLEDRVELCRVSDICLPDQNVIDVDWMHPESARSF